MGQKTNPIGFRLAVHRNWLSRWYANKKDFPALLLEDQVIRQKLMEKLKQASVPRIFIERASNRVRVKIFTARPGIVIGRKGQEIEKIKETWPSSPARRSCSTSRRSRSPRSRPSWSRKNVALQLERRIAFRRAMKKAVEMAMDARRPEGIQDPSSRPPRGARSLGGKWQRKGRVPLHTLRENIDYGFAEAHTLYGKDRRQMLDLQKRRGHDQLMAF